MTASLAATIRHNGGKIDGKTADHPALRYLIRMRLFETLGIDPKAKIQEHEAAGRFIPLTQIRNSNELSAAINNLVPLLHAQRREQDSIRYVFSELTRNVIEHAGSPTGAFLCAQYYRPTNRVSIGIADSGIGVRRSSSSPTSCRPFKQLTPVKRRTGAAKNTSVV